MRVLSMEELLAVSGGGKKSKACGAGKGKGGKGKGGKGGKGHGGKGKGGKGKRC
mgnify:CR=1 FL=1